MASTLLGISMASDVVGCIGSTDFAASGLERIHRTIPIGAWTVYRLRRNAPPVFELGATRGRDDVTRRCWHAYSQGPYRSDHSFDGARHRAARDTVGVSRLRPAQLSDEHRSHVYDRFDLAGRLSIVIADRLDAILALNLYRFREQPEFGDEAEATLSSAAPVLIAAVQRHLEIASRSRPRVGEAMPSAAVLRQQCPRLTDRELEVCDGLLQGWTFDGIAAHLNVSVATIKTYRDRAFRRLGIHHRNELYSVCLTGVRDRDEWDRDTQEAVR